jgi:hypothetical protein
LATTGTSRAVIGRDRFDTVLIQRGPETVALSSPMNATGMFELDSQPELLVPFEGIGVDTAWEFRLPKAANPIDYRTLFDVLVTIEYTALDSFDYRQQILGQLDRTILADRSFSFRYDFPDAWYDLHNPEQVEKSRQMVVGFRTDREDFPANLDPLSIRHVVLYFAPASGNLSDSVHVTHLELNGAGGEATSDKSGVISTRRGNASNWKPITGPPAKAPIGEWELSLNYGTPALDKTIRDRFTNEEFDDILLVISYAGATPTWPS